MSSVTIIHPFERPQGEEKRALNGQDRLAASPKKQPDNLSATLHQTLHTKARFHLTKTPKSKSENHFPASQQNPKSQAIAVTTGNKPNDPDIYQITRCKQEDL